MITSTRPIIGVARDTMPGTGSSTGTSGTSNTSSTTDTSSDGSGAITAAGGAMGETQFVQLLVTEMQNQDPLNPMDGKDLAVQLAQFSSVEQLMNVNTKLDDLTSAVKAQGSITAATGATSGTSGSSGTDTSGTDTSGTDTTAGAAG